MLILQPFPAQPMALPTLSVTLAQTFGGHIGLLSFPLSLSPPPPPSPPFAPPPLAYKEIM